MSERLSRRLGTVMILTGAILLLYPIGSGYWNELHRTRAVVSYAQAVSTLDHALCETVLAAAERYNAALADGDCHMVLPLEKEAEYNACLRLPDSESGVMCSLYIPKLGAELAVCHGTDEGMLLRYVGHMNATSLPVGGKGTHCALTGHSGLIDARIFTDLEQLTEGDIFILRTFGRELTYLVDRVQVVMPEDVDAVAIQPDEDLCTLVTCTPYGTALRRLLVRGHRIPNLPEPEVLAEPVTLRSDDAAVIIALILSAGVLLYRRIERKERANSRP